MNDAMVPFGVLSEQEDRDPPSAVTDLATTDTTSNSMKLTWTSPGDNGILEQLWSMISDIWKG